MGKVVMARAGRGRPASKQTLAERRERRVFKTLPISEIESTDPVSVLPVSEQLIIELLARGYRTVNDLSGLTALHAVQIPGMNGRHWEVIATALRREQFPMSLAEM